MKKFRSNQSSVGVPVWYQHSRVSYSFFASGSSSFLDFSMAASQRKISNFQVGKSDLNDDLSPTLSQKGALPVERQLSKRQNSYLEEVATIVSHNPLFPNSPSPNHLGISTERVSHQSTSGPFMIRNNLKDKAKLIEDKTQSYINSLNAPPQDLTPAISDRLSVHRG